MPYPDLEHVARLVDELRSDLDELADALANLHRDSVELCQLSDRGTGHGLDVFHVDDPAGRTLDALERLADATAPELEELAQPIATARHRFTTYAGTVAGYLNRQEPTP